MFAGHLSLTHNILYVVRHCFFQPHIRLAQVDVAVAEVKTVATCPREIQMPSRPRTREGDWRKIASAIEQPGVIPVLFRKRLLPPAPSSLRILLPSAP